MVRALGLPNLGLVYDIYHAQPLGTEVRASQAELRRTEAVDAVERQRTAPQGLPRLLTRPAPDHQRSGPGHD